MKHEIRISQLSHTQSVAVADLMERDKPRLLKRIKEAVQKEVDNYLADLAIGIHSTPQLGKPEVVLSVEVPD